ncbi:hypothetical protein OAR83_00470 [Alphaproteobacteria bacterium]|nr:hypothetical protein [Alphaproteobacteria bacterium]
MDNKEKRVLSSSIDLEIIIREKLLESYKNSDFDALSVDPDEDLYVSGVIDSLGLATLIGLVESETGLSASMRLVGDQEKFVFSIRGISMFFHADRV